MKKKKEEMIIESKITVDGIGKAYIYIEFIHNVKLTNNRYWYEIREPGKGKSLSTGEFEHDNDSPIELIKKVLLKEGGINEKWNL